MDDNLNQTVFAQLEAKARALGFDAVGCAAAEELTEDLAQLRVWLEQGRHGDMTWLARDPERRADPRRVLEGCRTVIILAMHYLQEPLPPPAEAVASPPAGLGRISKYARTRDYHRVMEKRLRKIARYIDEELCPGAQSRSFVDYGPVFERQWAQRAGLGFIGKHTLLIDPRRGSFFFLGSVLTTAEITHPLPSPATTYSCGNCRRCIDACPTGAITAPHQFDATRCISYLTIEKQGAIEDRFWPEMRGYVFGCDICQDVCPYNQARAEEGPSLALGGALVPATLPLADWLTRPEQVLQQLEGQSSPLRRAGPEALRRNAAVVASERGTPEDLEALHMIMEDRSHPEWLRAMVQECAARLSARLAGGENPHRLSGHDSG
ncbi:MAG TPA: tRNA epoxyqueuosine(34) reductase QueG [Salinarimonas sp.]|nr:tRNA epoxyqueuosine(34) reductase QueG [Salinarimonas sp.]